MELMLTGNYGPLKIRELANEEWGFRTPKGKKLGRSTIYRIFTNTFYYGMYEYPLGSGKWYRGTHETIITEEEYDKIQVLLGRKGRPRPKTHIFDSEALLDGIPNYVVFNGKLESTPRMEAKVGEKVRIYVGNGGVNLISSFHVIGEIFDTVYPEGNIGGSVEKNVQTTAVLPGGSSIVEFALDVPGNYLLVDHALARMNKGAWGILKVTGPENPEVFKSIDTKNHLHE